MPDTVQFFYKQNCKLSTLLQYKWEEVKQDNGALQKSYFLLVKNIFQQFELLKRALLTGIQIKQEVKKIKITNLKKRKKKKNFCRIIRLIT